jgi:hypothetical protein
LEQTWRRWQGRKRPGGLFVVYSVCHELTQAQFLLDALIAVLFLTAFLVLYNRADLLLVSISPGVVARIGLWAGYAIPGLPHSEATNE